MREIWVTWPVTIATRAHIMLALYQGLASPLCDGPSGRELSWQLSVCKSGDRQDTTVTQLIWSTSVTSTGLLQIQGILSNLHCPEN